MNNGIDLEVLDNMVDGIRKFHEQDFEEKKKWNSREMMQKVEYGSNVDLYRSRAANWRNSLTISLLNSDSLEPHELPQICRDSTIEYLNQVKKLADTLFELLSEALGLKPDHLGRDLELGPRARADHGHEQPHRSFFPNNSSCRNDDIVYDHYK